MIGKTLSHYRIVEKIGAGGMGEVYRAHDEHLGRDVAVKVLSAGTLQDEHARKRFRKEAEALSKLNDPHIATIFDFDTQDGTDFLVMEYVAGATLSQKLKAGRLPETEVAKLGTQIAEALEEAHAQNIVHRDLKPGNVMVTPKGQAKVLDFGLAKLVRPDVTSATATTESFTEMQGVAGTLPYMAPEQLRGEGVDARTDIYALGTVLYEMATGRRPFDARVPTALVADIQTKPPPPPRQFKADLLPRLENIILKALEKEPEDRYQSAKEIAVDLRRLGTPGSAAAVLSARRPATRRRMVWAAGVALVALLAVLVGLNVGGLRERLLGGVTPGQITSLVVLPLENMMGDAEQDYFVEGMHEALITELSKIGALKVISRTSAMRYKDSDKSVPEIARELGVDAVIEGSVLRVGEQVRITAQLIEAATDRHLWADNFDRELNDILALHSEVARAVAREILITVTPKEEARLASARTVNPEAYEAYLKGHYFLKQPSFEAEGFKRAVEYFEQAIEIDPGYALAYAGLADVYWKTDELPPKVVKPKAKAYVMKALELDDTLAQAHLSLGMVRFYLDWDWSGAEEAFKRAIALNPSYAIAHQGYSYYLTAMGRHDESIAEIKRARELDPLSTNVNVTAGQAFLVARQYDRAIEQFQRTLELDPNSFVARGLLGFAYARNGMVEEALEEVQKATALAGDHPNFKWWVGVFYASIGRRSEAQKLLDELKQLSNQRYVPPYWIAEIHGALDEKDQAFEWLERAYQERDGWLVKLGVAPYSDPLRSDPRFQSLLRRMNFPE